MNLTRAITDNGIENRGFRILSIPSSAEGKISFK
jgi:hypothetical protein